MKRSREELGRMHKEKCRELKQVRAKMAEDLGIDLHQTECTYEGYCSGTCPKCKGEELRLNAAILKKQMEESDMRRRVTAAGLTAVAALSLTGCDMLGGYEHTEGAATPPSVEETLEGDVATVVDYEGGMAEAPPSESVETGNRETATESGTACESTEATTVEPSDEYTLEILEGDIAYTEETTWELAGEVPVMIESEPGEE